MWLRMSSEPSCKIKEHIAVKQNYSVSLPDKIFGHSDNNLTAPVWKTNVSAQFFVCSQRENLKREFAGNFSVRVLVH